MSEQDEQITVRDNGPTFEASTELEVIQPSALESLERASIDMQISTARRYPRQLGIVRQRIMSLCTLDQETAATCFYHIRRRQGPEIKVIEGPSIRMAEIVFSCWGNIRSGGRVVGNDGKKITAQGFCHDLETNAMISVETQRRITTKEGRPFSEDMQVVTGNAATSIALRNAIFRVVPRVFIKSMLDAAKKVAVGDMKTLNERRGKMLEKFKELGVEQKRLLSALGKTSVEEIGLGEMEVLIGLHNAIRDNEQTIDEAFPLPEKPKSAESLPLGEGAPLTEKKPRGRKTKEVDKNAGDSPTPPDSTTASNVPATNGNPAPPPLATPLQGLRNLIAGTPFSEADYLKYLRTKTELIDHNPQAASFEALDEETQLKIIGRFMDIAQQMADTPHGNKA